MGLKINPNMFGLPYQFPSTTDPRIATVSNVLGRKYASNIGTEAPICTFIPGTASYLSNNNSKNKINSAIALLSGNENFTGVGGVSLSSAKEDFDSKRLYDFKNDYTDYIKYVNALCRAGAIFLEIGDVRLGDTPLKSYNWKNYRWGSSGSNSISGSVGASSAGLPSDSSSGDSSLDRIATNKYFVQFYVDADVSSSDNFSNSTSESMIKGMLDTGSSTMKELAFMANSGIGADGLSSFVDSSSNALTSGISSILGGGTVTNGLSRIINLGSETLKGNNLIMPDVYQSSSYTKSYSITIHLKSPYGNRLGYYLNIFVPMIHALCLAMPRQASANSYESPFLVKAYVDGIFSCNMGIIQSISVSKSAESMTIDGLPTEVDISIDLVDLYSGIQMTDSQSPLLFMNNSSLIEFLSVNCGLSLISPNISKKVDLLADTTLNAFRDIPTNVGGRVKEGIYSWVNSLLRLY